MATSAVPDNDSVTQAHQHGINGIRETIRCFSLCLAEKEIPKQPTLMQNSSKYLSADETADNKIGVQQPGDPFCRSACTYTTSLPMVLSQFAIGLRLSRKSASGEMTGLRIGRFTLHTENEINIELYSERSKEICFSAFHDVQSFAKSLHFTARECDNALCSANPRGRN